MKLIRKVFSKKEEKKEVKLGKSVRGVGRSIAENGIPGAIALGRGKKAADKAAKEGKSEAEVIDAAGRKAKRTMRAMEAGATAAGLGVAAVAGRGVTKAIGKNKDKIAKVAKEVADQVKLKVDGFAVDNKSFLGKTGKLVQSAQATNKAKAIRDLGANIIKNRSKIGAGVAAGLGSLVVIAGGKRMFRRGRLAENAAHKNTIERIKDGKKEEKKFSVIQPQDIKLYSKSEKSEKKDNDKVKDIKKRAKIVLDKKSLKSIAGTGASIGAVAGGAHGLVSGAPILRSVRGAALGAAIPTAGVYIYRKIKKSTEEK